MFVIDARLWFIWRRTQFVIFFMCAQFGGEGCAIALTGTTTFCVDHWMSVWKRALRFSCLHFARGRVQRHLEGPESE